MKFFYIKFGKRLFDLLFSMFLIFLSLPLLLISILIMIVLNKSFNVLYFQVRPGKNEKLFKVVKLKTMNDKVNPDGYLLPDEERTTKIGRFLRKLSIDELPQLWNVVRGDMSLIGPRPLLVEYLPHYTHEQKRRHNVLPGITGWAQIHGRNSIQFKDRFKLDVWYVENLSFSLDMRILFKTIIKIFKSEHVLIQDPNKITD